MVHFNDIREVLNLLRDMQAYIFIQSKNDALAKLILQRIEKILEDNDSDLEEKDGELKLK